MGMLLTYHDGYQPEPEPKAEKPKARKGKADKSED